MATRRKIRNATRAFYEGVWALTPEKLAEIDHFFTRRAAGALLEQAELRALCGAEDNREAETPPCHA